MLSVGHSMRILQCFGKQGLVYFASLRVTAVYILSYNSVVTQETAFSCYIVHITFLFNLAEN